MLSFETTESWWSPTVILSVLAFFGVGAGVKRLANWLWERRITRSIGSFELEFSTSVVLEELRKKLGGHRAVILVAHNGGKDISVSRPLFTSVRFQVHDKELPRVEWNRVPVDEDYWKLLSSVKRSQGAPFILHTMDLEPGSALHALYASQGVEHSYTFELFATPEEYWYVSVNRKQEPIATQDAQAHEAIRCARALLVRRLRDKKL